MSNGVCACCGKEDVEKFDVCETCDWQNDPMQNENPDYKGGANKLSLNEAKKLYNN